MNIIADSKNYEMTKEPPMQEPKTLYSNSNNSENNILISWIIIGRNWTDGIEELIFSLNNQNWEQKNVELILVDDASNNKSYEKLNNINFSNKKIIKIKNNIGRSAARNIGINEACGKYCLFTQSSAIPENSFLSKYYKKISNNNYDGLAGPYIYTCKNKIFEKYLNNFNRGINKYIDDSQVSIECVLFGNCAIKTSILQNIGGFNKQLNKYGGEEFELLDRIKKHNNNFYIYKINAKIFRANHPNLENHCIRLVEFGNTNFKLLPYSLQTKIIPSFFIKAHIFFPLFFIYYMLLFLYNRFNINSFLLIKILMGISILKGYSKK